MTNPPNTPFLDSVAGPADIRRMNDTAIANLADDVRAEVISAV